MPPQRATDQDNGVKCGGHCCQVVHHLLGGPEAGLSHVSNIQTQLSEDGSPQRVKSDRRQEKGEKLQFNTHNRVQHAHRSHASTTVGDTHFPNDMR